MKWFKRFGIGLIVVVVLTLIGLMLFMYKAKHGFASYEITPHDISIPADRPAILVFSKTTAFRHGSAIEAAVPAIEQLSMDHGWHVYSTEDAGIFNESQLELFDVVIWNNSTGRVLTDDQRTIFQAYIENGGGYVGIHGAGDFSHAWDWYRHKLISADFSHHPIKKHIQKADVFLSSDADSTWTTPPVWTQDDEWYIFDESPTKKGAQILYFIDGTKIDPDGNLLWINDKDFGMGEIHPVVWTKEIAQGRSFYTSMGHTAATFENKNMLALLSQAIKWAGKF